MTLHSNQHGTRYDLTARFGLRDAREEHHDDGEHTSRGGHHPSPRYPRSDCPSTRTVGAFRHRGATRRNQHAAPEFTAARIQLRKEEKQPGIFPYHTEILWTALFRMWVP